MHVFVVLSRAKFVPQVGSAFAVEIEVEIDAAAVTTNTDSVTGIKLGSN